LINADFDDDKVTADGLVRLIAHAPKDAPADDRCDGSIAEIQLTGGEGKLAGPLLDARTWDKITGRVHLAANGWNLHCLSKLAPLGMVVSDIRGLLDTELTIDRPVGQRFASVRDLFVRTRGLEVAGPLELREGAPPAPAWQSRALDLQLTGNIDGETGKTKL